MCGFNRTLMFLSYCKESKYFFLLFLLQWGRVAMDPFSQLILLISVVSFCTFQWLFHSVSPWASSRISPGFLKLTHKQKIEWNSRYTNMICVICLSAGTSSAFLFPCITFSCSVFLQKSDCKLYLFDSLKRTGSQGSCI